MKFKSIDLDVNDCVVSRTNPRGSVVIGPEFEDLVASIKQSGVLQPLIVRPHGKKFEVVAGNRRFVAAVKAGLKTVPARMAELTDEQAQEIQIVENLQRQDVHPLDEGQAYRILREKMKLDLPTIAARVGKPERYVKLRLFLTNLEEKCQDSYRNGKIHEGHAVLIAKLSAKDQLTALSATVGRWRILDVKDLKEWIQNNIYTQLEQQPWVGKPELMKAVGPCVECKPERMSLFGEVKEGACTDVLCWQRKMTKYLDHVAASEKRTRISSEYGQAPRGMISRGDYVLVAEKGKDRCESVQPALVVRGEDVGERRLICSNPKCKTHKGAANEYGRSKSEIAAEKARRKREAAKAEEEGKALEKACKKITWPMSEKHLAILLQTVIHNAAEESVRRLVKRRGWTVLKSKSWSGDKTEGRADYTKTLKVEAVKLDSAGKIRVIFEAILGGRWDGKKIAKSL